MKNLREILGTIVIFSSSLVLAEPVLVPEEPMVKATPSIESAPESEEILLEARQKLEAAELLAAQIIDAARLESEKIRQERMVDADINTDIESIKSEVIAVEARSLSIQALLSKVMPSHWRVMVDLDQDMKNKRLDFIAEKTRDEMVFDITQSLSLQYQYFSGLKDSDGNSSPLLVVTKNP